MTNIGDEIGTVTDYTCTLEYIDDIIPGRCMRTRSYREGGKLHHDIHSAQLWPHLKAASQHDSAWITRLEQIKVRFGAFCALKVDLIFRVLEIHYFWRKENYLLSDFLEFELDKLIIRIASTMKVSKNLKSFIFPIHYKSANLSKG